MKQAQVVLSDLASQHVITAILKTGFDSGLRPYRIISGLPRDAKLVEVNMLDNPRALQMIFESEEFEDVEDPKNTTPLAIVATSYRSET